MSELHGKTPQRLLCLRRVQDNIKSDMDRLCSIVNDVLVKVAEVCCRMPTMLVLGREEVRTEV